MRDRGAASPNRARLFAAVVLTVALPATSIGQSRPSPSSPSSTSTSRSEPASRRRDPEITVKSRAAAPRSGSEFLRPPGTERYEPDPGDEPLPWRQATFFGIRARGRFFIYVVDCSGSMIDDNRLVRAKSELRHSVFSLQPPQRFLVIFYNDRPLAQPGGLPHPADLGDKYRFNEWLRLIEPDGETDPRGAMAQALSLRPDAVFLLSDGEFPDGTAEAIAARNSRKTPIHCVDLSAGLAGDQLARIARESGGQYRSRPPRADEISH